MSVRWLYPKSGGGWAIETYIEDVAPSMRIGASKHEKQTWFIVNLQPDGICMNCRARPGLQDPIGGYYSCSDCREQSVRAIAQLLTAQAA